MKKYPADKIRKAIAEVLSDDENLCAYNEAITNLKISVEDELGDASSVEGKYDEDTFTDTFDHEWAIEWLKLQVEAYVPFLYKMDKQRLCNKILK